MAIMIKSGDLPAHGKLIRTETATFYVKDKSGELMPCLGLVFYYENGTVIEHVGRTDTRDVILEVKPRTVRIEGVDHRVSRVMQGDNGHAYLIINNDNINLSYVMARPARQLTIGECR